MNIDSVVKGILLDSRQQQNSAQSLWGETMNKLVCTKPLVCAHHYRQCNKRGNVAWIIFEINQLCASHDTDIH